jgi:peptide chain release factor 2
VPLLQITAGAGESYDWANMLMRMYLMYAEKESGYKVKSLTTKGDVAGIKA